MTVRELAKLHNMRPARICMILAMYGFVFDFGPLRPVRRTRGVS